MIEGTRERGRETGRGPLAILARKPARRLAQGPGFPSPLTLVKKRPGTRFGVLEFRVLGQLALMLARENAETLKSQPKLSGDVRAVKACGGWPNRRRVLGQAVLAGRATGLFRPLKACSADLANLGMFKHCRRVKDCQQHQ